MDLSYLQVMDPVKGALGQAVIMLITAIYENIVQYGDQDIYPKDHSYILLKQRTVPTYDFIVIGGSTAGCIMTNRLSGNPDFSILLIEAGNYPSPSTDVPFLHFTLENSDEDWNFLTTEEKYACQSYLGGRCLISRGKVLGGTTTINNMHYHRGNDYDYDRWDLNEWKSATCKKYFANVENYVGKAATPFEVGTKGNLTLSYFNSDHFLRLPLSKMYKSAGYKPLSKGKLLGYIDMLVASWKSIRMNMPRMFLNPVKDRLNFHVTLRTTATRVLFTKEKKVRAVEVMIGNTKKVIKVSKEVILTAGPINDVKLLQMSGIGPREILEDQHIPVIADLPVGKNFQAHVRVPLFIAIDKCCGQCLNCSQPDCQNDFFELHEFFRNTYEYIMDKIGPLTNTGINDFVAYISTNQKKKKRDRPNIAVFHTYFKRNDFYLKRFLECRRFHPAVTASVLKYNKVRNIMVLHPSILSPESRGEIYINTTHHLAQPVIQPNFLTDENGLDYRNLYAAITMLVSLTDSLAMQRYKAKFLNIDIPNCRNFKFCSEYYFRCLILNLGYPLRTCCGTCKIGKVEDKETIVDANFTVKIVKGLRVADQSIVPHLGTAKTPAIGLFAERLSEILTTKYSKQAKREKAAIV